MSNLEGEGRGGKGKNALPNPTECKLSPCDKRKTLIQEFCWGEKRDEKDARGV